MGQITFITGQVVDGGGVGDAATLEGHNGEHYLNRANHSGTQEAETIEVDAEHQFVTETEKVVWNAKQAALGFTPVNTLDSRLSDARAPTTHSHSIDQVTGLTAALANKVTQTEIDSAVNSLVQGAPGALDTLNELAAALGDDPNFAITLINALAAKAPLVSPVLTGVPTGPTAEAGTNNTQLATTAFVLAAISEALPVTYRQVDEPTESVKDNDFWIIP